MEKHRERFVTSLATRGRSCVLCVSRLILTVLAYASLQPRRVWSLIGFGLMGGWIVDRPTKCLWSPGESVFFWPSSSVVQVMDPGPAVLGSSGLLWVACHVTQLCASLQDALTQFSSFNYWRAPIADIHLLLADLWPLDPFARLVTWPSPGFS